MAQSAYGRLPLRFEANQGQADPAARFVVRAGGAVVYLTGHDALFAMTAPRPRRDSKSPATAPDPSPPAPPAVVRLGLAGANPAPRVSGADRLPGVSNYFIGNDPAKWRTGVPAYAGVRYAGVYPGVDLVYHGGDGGLEYDFEVAPGADTAPIAMTLSGADRPTLDAKGDVVAHVGAVELRQHTPAVYQQAGSDRRAIGSRFVVRPDGSVGFALGAYDHHVPLIIDPIITYSTFLGGTGDDAVNGIALDSSNDAYLTGWTTSTNFPVTTGTVQTNCTKCNNGGVQGANSVAFVTELNPAGTATVYSTYLGGTNGDENGSKGLGGGIAVDSSGNVYLSGRTSSTDFPTPNGYKTTCGSAGTPCTPGGFGPNDGFVAKLNATGSTLLYGSYVGGSGADWCQALALGGPGVVYVAGLTASTDLIPTGAGAPSAAPYRSASGGGDDAFLVKINTAGSGSSSLLYATYLGGSGNDGANALAVDPASPNVAYVAGYSQSTNFPTTASAYQTTSVGGQRGFLAKIDTTAGAAGLLYSTYVGGAGGSSAFNGAAVKGGVAYLTGDTYSAAYPVSGTSAAYQTTFAGTGGNSNVVVSDIDTTQSGALSLAYSTYLGGPGGNNSDVGYAIAVDAANKVTVTGDGAAGFPVNNQVQNFSGSPNAFVAQLDPTAGAAGLVYSTALGSGEGYAVAVDGANPSNAFVAGQTTDSAFPTTPGAFQTGFASSSPAFGDGFVTKLRAGVQPFVGSVSPAGGVFTGGTTVTVNGGGFTGATGVNFGAVAAASFTVNSNTQITAVSPCVAPVGTACPDSALGTVSADTVDVTVTGTAATSATGRADQFVYGEGKSAASPACSSCWNGAPRTAVALAGGKVLTTATGTDPYYDGSGTLGSNVFTSGTSASHQASFSAADVGKRLSAQGAAGTFLFPPGTTIQSVTNANTVVVSNTATATSTSPGAFDVSRNDTEIYNPATDTWAASGSCNGCGATSSSVGGLTLTVLANGKVLAAGGLDPTYYHTNPDTRAVAEAFIFDPGAGTWSATGSLTTARKGATATLLSSGQVLVAGGSNIGAPAATSVDPTASSELYNPATGTFAATTGSMTTARAHAAALLLAGGNVLVAGGMVAAGPGATNQPATASAEQYNPAAGTWSSAGSMNTARWLHSLTALPASGACGSNCGKVLVANGSSCYNDCPPPPPAQDAAVSSELYTPGSPGSWSYTGATNAARRGAEAALLPSGKVLVNAGGAGVAERYDPAAGSWKSAGLSVDGSDCCAVVLPQGPASVCATRCGQVLFTGNPSYYTPRPAITGLAPASGPVGSSVTLTGTGLASVTSVSFGGVAGSGVAHDAASPDTTLTVTVPSGLAAGSAVSVIATSSGGPSSPSGPQFTVSNLAGAVVGLVASAANGAAVVSWSPPAANGGSAVTSYTVSTNAPAGGLAPAAVSVPASSCSPNCSTVVSGLSNSLTLAGRGGYSFGVVAVNANGAGVSSTSNTVFPQVVVGSFTAVTPARILDTRTAAQDQAAPIGQCSPPGSPSFTCTKLGTGIVKVQVTGLGGIPASGVNAVVMNVAAVTPSASSVLRIWPDDAPEPNASNLNYTAGQVIPNLVTVKLGADGGVNIHNTSGTVDVVADVAGWYSDGTATPGTFAAIAGSRFNPLPPARVLDTRTPAQDPAAPIGQCTPGSPTPKCSQFGTGIVKVQVTGLGGVPSGASAVVMNVAAVTPSTSSVLRIWPDDAPEPNASSLNYTAGQVIPNLVTVKLGADGGVNMHNTSGTVDVVADVAGWYSQPGSINGDRYAPLTPARVLDTRTPAQDPAAPIGQCTPPGSPSFTCSRFGTTVVKVQISGLGGVPASGASAVVMNVAAVTPSTSSVLRVWPDDVTEPNASNLNYTTGQVIPNLVLVKLGADGGVDMHNTSGTVDVVADAGGWFNDGSS